MLLLLFGCVVILLGLLVFGVGLAITHYDDFHDTLGLKEQVNPDIDYVQYWIGIPYVITGISVACSAVNLRRFSLTMCTFILSVVCVVLSLAGLVVDGPDWVKWKNFRASQRYWEGQDGYACVSKNDTCSCVGKTSQYIALFTDCETLGDLAATYGVLIASFIIVLTILLATIILMVYILSSKAERARRTRKDRGVVTTVIQTKSSQRRNDEPVVIPNTNQGYEEQLTASRRNQGHSNDERTRIIQDAYKSKGSGDLNYQNREGNVGSAEANGGMIMLDPGHFKLEDDDIS